MKKLGFVAMALLLSLPAFAKKHDASEYQDAVLTNFHTEQHGTRCATSGNTTGTVNADTRPLGDGSTTSGTIQGQNSSSTSCSPRMEAFYAIAIADHAYVLTPALTPTRAGATVLTVGAAALFFKNSVLYGVLPGTHVQVRNDGGKFFVKVGKRESEYKLSSAQ